MKDIRLKKIVDQKNIDLEGISKKTLVPYSTLKEWYDTSTFDGDKVGVQELTEVAAALECEITELIDFPNS